MTEQNDTDMDIELQNRIVSADTLRWKDQALCIGKQDLFFNDHKQTCVRAAKAICAECPAKTPCLEYALTHTEYGVWGGMTANERRMHRRNMRKKEKMALVK